jgi:hypothetical protein
VNLPPAVKEIEGREAELRSSRASRVLPPGCGYGSLGGGLTRNPLRPLQESPGWKPDALR